MALLGACELEDNHLLHEWRLELPEGSRDVRLPGELPASDDPFFTLETSIPAELFPGEPLQLIAPVVFAHADLSVDGTRLHPSHQPMLRGHRATSVQRWIISAEERRPGATITLRIPNTHFQSPSIPATPRLARVDASDAHATAITIANTYGSILAAITTLFSGLTYLLIFLVDRRRTDSLWFALQTLTASVLPLYYLGATQLAFGRYDVSAVGIALTAAAITGVYFTHKRFGLPLHGRVWNTVMLVSTVVALALADPFEVLLIARLTVLTVAGVCIHQIVLLGRRVLQGGRSGEAWILAAWIAIALTAWCDMFAWFGIGEPLGGIRLSGFGLFFFAGLQALSLSRDHIRLLNRSDLLNEELAARVSELETRQAEIELLNHELRRQIADRSGRLVAALRLAAEDPQTPTLQPGDVINERYKVVRELGRGGMGAVHEVIRQADGKHLALKVARCLDGLDIARLAREAEIAAQVVHPNIVAIVDVDISATGFLYVVMELAEGTTLQKVGDQDVRWSLEVLAQVAEGLAALHDAGVIHRDLKPSNVIVAKGPHAKITDFGISRLVTHDSIPPSSSVTGETATSRKATTSAEPAESEDAEQDSTLVLSGARSREPLTQTGMLTGTPRYLAPELVESEALSLASDIFSFGVVAFELLAETPFAEPPALAILQEREPTRCGSLSEVALSPHVRELLERCLSLSPENRPAPDELARALRSPPAIASDAEIYGALDATRVGDR